jgi:predicted phosphodiesterase
MTQELLVPEDELLAPVVELDARRIGLLGDDHNAQEDGADLPEQVLSALDGVDLILHLGHLGFRDVLARGVLDRLAEVAPVRSVRDLSTGADGARFATPADGDRVAGLARVLDLGHTRIGMTHNPSTPPGPAIPTPPGGLPQLAGLDVRALVAAKFGAEVEVVAFGSSHRACAVCAGGVLFVNPGSPTYPKGPGRTEGVKSLGTVGVLEVSAGTASFEVLELSNFE